MTRNRDGQITSHTCRHYLVRCGMRVDQSMTSSRARNVGDDGCLPITAMRNRPCPKWTKVQGDREHRLSPRLSLRQGQSLGLDLTMASARVIYPQKRVGERGSGQWQQVSWDEALDDIAMRLNAIIAEHGPRAVAVQALPPKEYFAYDIFCDAIGSPTFFKHDRTSASRRSSCRTS